MTESLHIFTYMYYIHALAWKQIQCVPIHVMTSNASSEMFKFMSLV